jgi:transcriptional regulator with XRE-family HTH domain
MAKLSEDHEGPDPVDRHVGLRLRMRRKEMGVSQEKLAEAIGLTFQQVQKYERAANRMSASKLWEAAQALHTTVSYFYEGLGDAAANSPRGARLPAEDFLMTDEGLELAANFPRIRHPSLRRRLLELVRALGETPIEP